MVWGMSVIGLLVGYVISVSHFVVMLDDSSFVGRSAS